MDSVSCWGVGQAADYSLPRHHTARGWAAELVAVVSPPTATQSVDDGHAIAPTQREDSRYARERPSATCVDVRRGQAAGCRTASVHAPSRQARGPH